MTLREASPLTHENVAMIAGATGQGGAYLGETYSVREFVELAFAQIGHRIEWRGRLSTKRASMRTAVTHSSPSIRGISDRPRLICCSAIRQRRGSVWVGVTRSNSPTWRVRWSRALPLC